MSQVYCVEAVVRAQVVSENVNLEGHARYVMKYFVKWVGYPSKDNSWVTDDDLAGGFDVYREAKPSIKAIAEWESMKKKKGGIMKAAKKVAKKKKKTKQQKTTPTEPLSADSDDEPSMKEKIVHSLHSIFNSGTIQELRDLCRENNLLTTGDKTQLIDRLVEFEGEKVLTSDKKQTGKRRLSLSDFESEGEDDENKEEEGKKKLKVKTATTSTRTTTTTPTPTPSPAPTTPTPSPTPTPTPTPTPAPTPTPDPTLSSSSSKSPIALPVPHIVVWSRAYIPGSEMYSGGAPTVDSYHTCAEQANRQVQLLFVRKNPWQAETQDFLDDMGDDGIKVSFSRGLLRMYVQQYDEKWKVMAETKADFEKRLQRHIDEADDAELYD